MNKGMKYFTEGMIAAFVLAPRVPVHAIKPVIIEEQRPIGNAARHWEVVGHRMTKKKKKIEAELKLTYPELNTAQPF